MGYLVDITQSGFVKPGFMEMDWGDIPAAFVEGNVASLGTTPSSTQTLPKALICSLCDQ